MEDVLPLSPDPVDGKGHCQTAGPFFIPCLRCGECCWKYQVCVDLEEAGRLAQGLGISVERFVEVYADRRWPDGRSVMVRHENGHCVFLDVGVDARANSCLIHLFRPSSCREWVPGLDHVECRMGLMKLLGISTGRSGEVVSLEEGAALLEAHPEVLTTSRRN